MMNLINVKPIDPLSDLRWDTFVNNHPYSTIYHHSCWMKVITQTYKHVRQLCFVLEDGKENILAALPCFVVKSILTGTRLVSLPFTSYCDPLVENKKDFIPLLEEVVRKLGDISGSYYELRVFRHQDIVQNDRLKSHNYHKIHIINIKDKFEKIRRLFSKGHVHSTKKAIKSGVIIREGCSERDLEKFYFIHTITRRRLGLPIQPYKFFKNMWEIMYPKGYLTLLLAEWNGKTIAGNILYKFKETVSVEHGASIPKYLFVGPNHLLDWKAIESACSEGYHYFDFGKTTLDNKGLLEYKTRWGAEMYDLSYFYYPEIKGMMSLEQNDLRHRFLVALQRHLPLSLTKVIGKIAYHHLG